MPPISDSDIKWYLADSMATSDEAVAGGGKSATEIEGNVDEVFQTQAIRESGGSTLIHYAKIFVANDHASAQLSAARVYVSTLEYVGQIAIGLEASAGGAYLDGETQLSNPLTAPDHTSFSLPKSYSSGLLVGGDGVFPAGTSQGIFLRQTIAPGSTKDASVFLRMALAGS